MVGSIGASINEKNRFVHICISTTLGKQILRGKIFEQEEKTEEAFKRYAFQTVCIANLARCGVSFSCRACEIL